MELVYATQKVEEQCTSVKAAQKLFGGDTTLTKSLMARINALKQADTIKDIVVQPTFRFHKLYNKEGRNLEGYFAIDVKTKREKWRIILEPLDENNQPYDSCEIDKISDLVRIVEIVEVSNHYE